MSKAIRWQIPFVSLQGIHYRVDIYDEGTFTPVQLTAGPTPFTTDEDASDDFFAPIRTQTGTLQICTLKPDGTYITLDELLPANNIARPVRLLNLDNSNTIEWQGFLSCEAYSQDYTGIPQNLSLPVIGVLEAMASIEVELSEDMAFKKIMGHVAYAMKAIETESGMSLFDQLYIASYVKTALTTQYFYNNVYFESKELVSGDNIVVEVHSISCKSILEQVAKFFGCCWREKGQNIYLEAIGKSSYAFHSFTAIYNTYVAETSGIVWLSAAGSTADLSDQKWMGTGHQRNVVQGMRRVKVSAKLDDFSADMTLQETPVNNLVENPSARQSNWGEAHVNTNETFYSLAEHRHMLAKAVFPTDLSGAHLDFVRDLSGINYARTAFWETSLFREHYYQLVNTQTQGSNDGLDCYITSFMMYLRDTEDNELKSCLAICGVPKRLIWSGGYTPQGRVWTKFALTDSNYVFKQTTPLIFSASSGYLNIDIETLAWSGVGMLNPDCPANNVNLNEPGPAITIAVRFGSKWLYYDGSAYVWSDDFHTINYAFTRGTSTKFGKFKPVGNWSSDMPIDEVSGLVVEIPSFMVGFVSVYVYHEVNAYTDQPYASGMFDVILSKLDVKYIPITLELRTDRSENTYATETSQAFRDELAVSVDLASYANNTKLATMIWDDSTTPTKLITLGATTIRPEVDLLNRLAEYYRAARQRLELEVEHPTINGASAPLPLLRLNGIGDGKVYLPLSESRDWQTDVCKLTCFEMPQEPSES